ncbi:MAG: D-alanyl-D-alanine carboxypeptidase family protein [bacterium]
MAIPARAFAPANTPANATARTTRFSFTRAFAIAFALLACAQASAQALKPIPPPLQSAESPPQVEAKSWVLADFDSGWVIASSNADLRIEPASLTKLMTGYLAFDALAKGETALDTQVLISEKAWRTGGSRMFVQVDTRVSVDDLLRGLIIQSGNDAAVALAEHLGGSEAHFAQRMNRMAQRLGMINTQFANASGLPHPQQYSTALDMSALARALIRDFPERFRLYSEREFTYNGITQPNRNKLLWRDPSVDGLKTGYTEKAGYCLIGTARRDGMRLIAAVTGAQDARARADQVQSLLRHGFFAYAQMTAYQSGEEIAELPLWMGQQPRARIGIEHDLRILHPKGAHDKLSGALELPDSLDAPLQAGQAVGRLVVKFDGEAVRDTELQVAQDYAEGAWWSQWLDSIKRLIF